mgnify:CR=1 FL=1|jgi:hypothetical protein
MWGFGATLGADAANAAVGEMRVRLALLPVRQHDADDHIAMVETLNSRLAVPFSH